MMLMCLTVLEIATCVASFRLGRSHVWINDSLELRSLVSVVTERHSHSVTLDIHRQSLAEATAWTVRHFAQMTTRPPV